MRGPDLLLKISRDQKVSNIRHPLTPIILHGYKLWRKRDFILYQYASAGYT
ncbi:hypothetical protein [uncultured Pontibacter sp.]|uniref:hypothetical protein n=1 Tax=uncultured Pontibacter sp. TaxID=453356 RepID=UPI0026251B89|nr:hypothetical protein [uncultured Pontibacter sp.]